MNTTHYYCYECSEIVEDDMPRGAHAWNLCHDAFMKVINEQEEYKKITLYKGACPQSNLWTTISGKDAELHNHVFEHSIYKSKCVACGLEYTPNSIKPEPVKNSINLISPQEEMIKHGECLKNIHPQTSPAKHEQQLQPLNEKLVRNALETKHGLTDHQSMLLWHTISEFGNPKQQKVSVEEIYKILNNHINDYSNGKYSYKLSMAIHDRIYGKGK